jgi:hypothetical protein
MFIKRIFLLGITFLLTSLLLGCTCDSSYFLNSSNSCSGNCAPAPDLVTETWLRQVQTNPQLWACGADSWFLTGEPNSIEKCDFQAPADKALSLMKVRVPDFVNIKVNGNFQVQIVGGQKRTSVRILGPNDAVRLTAIDVFGNTIYVHQAPNCEKVCGPIYMSRVIVRIGVRDLRKLTNEGNGNIYGRNICTRCLDVFSTGNGNIMLNGMMNLRRVKQTGCGTVTLAGACTPYLEMKVLGPGTVNISGRVGIQSILHYGYGRVNIIGADTDSLVVNTGGCGITSVYGFVNLKKVVATQNSRVYIYWVNGVGTYVRERDRAEVGLAGTTSYLNVDAYDNSIFWGQYLRGRQSYIHTHNNAHANVSVDNKLFANAEDNSSIYFFGSPCKVAKFSTHNGTIIQISKLEVTPPPKPLPWNSPQRYKDAGWVYK